MQTDYKKKIPELLAPAGNILSAVSALDSGADAVYIGLQKFNARERAENFTYTDASKLINYAHTSGKKVYITFNTLIKESELHEAFEMLSEIAELAPDAVIVQDIGVVYMIREFFPSLEIHASTQMGIHNSAGVKTAADMGIKRVILERQIKNSELNLILRNSQIEIEIFVHGALCCSLSGRCLFSSWLGGWSGNRGKCTQPCRRRFYSDTGNGFFFSTKDLSMLDMIPQLKKMGVSSFKIEGRLKKPDYISSIVSAYRMVIDAPANQAQNALKTAQEIIRKSAGRECSAGFSSDNALKELINPRKMGVTGIYCGEVKSSLKNGFTASVTKKIHTGDILRIQKYAGDDSSALSVSAIVISGKAVTKAVKGDTCFIKCNRSVPENASIYKTGESYDRKSARLANLKPQKRKIDINIRISSEGFIVKTEKKEWKKMFEIASAEKHPLTEEKVIDAFKSSNSDIFDAGKTDVKIKGSLFLPASLLKQIRREFWLSVASEPPENKSEHKKSASLKKFSAFLENLKLEASKNRDRQNSEEITVCSSDTTNLFHAGKNAVEIIIPPFCPENNIRKTAEKIKSLCRENSSLKFRVTSLYAFELLKKNQTSNIAISFPFPVCNSPAICEIRRITAGKLKIDTVQAWIELEKAELLNLIERSPEKIEIFSEGSVPLMATRAEIPISGTIHDDRGAGYSIEKDAETGITYIFSDKELQIPYIPGTAVFKSRNRAPHKNKITTFNYNRELA